MSLELVGALASVGTFVVIAATAIAAVIQLIHIRSSNQIAILTNFRESTEDPAFVAGMDFFPGLSAQLEEPEFRARLNTRPLPPELYIINRVCRLFENLGCFVKRGMLDADLVLDLWGPVVERAWGMLADTIVVMRRTRGQALFEDFEYLAVLNKQYRAIHPTAYPKGALHIAPPDRWAKEDGLAVAPREGA